MRLLICTLYFPPCTFTPANRTFSWAKYLMRFGIYPIVITRQWPASNIGDNYFERAEGTELIIEKHEDYEVHYVPFLGNYRTRAQEKKLKHTKTTFFAKLFTAIEILFRYFFTSLLPYGNLFSYSIDYIKNNPVDKILISGSPFMLFKIGYIASKKYKIPWVADYRDGWTTDAYPDQVGILTNPVHVLNKFFEKKWVSTAAVFTTVSDHLRAGIEKYTGVKGFVVYNGFFAEKDIPKPITANKTGIRFLYSGVMYPRQDYRTPVTVFKKIIDRYKDQIDIEFVFLGTVYADEAFKNDPIFKGYGDNILLTERVNYKAALVIHESADIFLMFTHQGMKGIVSSKLFDYIKFHKPVLLFPGDGDILDELLLRSGLGIIVNDAVVLEKKLAYLIEQKMETGFIESHPDIEYINSFNRENQAGTLAEVIKANFA